ncbi:TPA: hypothetical protein N0F65_007631 [Lagenidium giganteum]|uniref:t-SNARE coiled-coil homology domain-containing protein n=1 Tax=Lagenidium giganteum TaxID=4803 RepID=A0AAV2Z7D3_9STRA|nr:TPA: hypothetical protein N0F65_007631 [Lagenidium giganteum]
MSFADFAAGASSGRMNTGATRASLTGSGQGSNSKGKQAIDSATLKLEQFQRQVLAIKRAANDPRTSSGSSSDLERKTSVGGGLLDDDLHDRIRFACLLQEEIAKCLQLIPQDTTNSLIKRKLCKDFEVISGQLETAVTKISSREQAIQDSLKEQSNQAQEQGGRIVVEHQGQVIEFAELENEIAHNEALIEERERDIEKIHTSVAQVNEIFRDLAAIVNEQQTAIDEIETHVHESLQQTQHGLDEVKKASEMQRTCVIQ